MATAKKLPSGQWRTLVYSHTDEHGKRKYESFTADTKKESEFLAAEFSLRRDKKSVLNITFDEAVNLFMEKNKNILSPSTLRGYRTIQRNCIESIRYLKLKSISDTAIQEQIYSNSFRYSPKSLNNQIGFISLICKNYGVPFDSANIRRKPKRPKEIVIPTEKDVQKILEMIQGTKIEIPILLALHGLRQSEISAAKWSNFDGKILKVRGAVVPDEHNKLTLKPENKSFHSTRDVVLVDDTAKRLTELKTTSQSDTMSPYIPSSVLRAFKKLCVQNGLPPYTIHSLRHYYASLMLKLGVPDKYAMDILGQTSNNMLKQVYQHTFQSEFEQINDKINNHYKQMQHEMQHEF